MAVKKKGGLGKGLGALIGTDEENEVQETPSVIKKPTTKPQSTKKKETVVDNSPKMVDIYDVEPDRDQPRKEFDQDGLEELAQSIKQYGVLQPILVNKSEGYYKIIAGERRWRAAKLAGVQQVPIIVKELTNERAFEISLIENIQREDLNPIEEALAYRRLMDEYHMTQETMAERVGKSRSGIANSLRLLNLDPAVQDMIRSGSLSLGHAKVLSGVSGEMQTKLAERTVSEGWSVRQLETAVKNAGKERRKTEMPQIPQYQEVERKLRSILGTKVNVQYGKRKGRIEIEYYSEEDLDRLMMLISSINKEE